MGIDYQFLHFQQTRDEIHGNEYHFHQGSTDRLVKKFRIFIGSARTEIFHFRKWKMAWPRPSNAQARLGTAPDHLVRRSLTFTIVIM